MINIYLNQKTGTRPLVQSCKEDAPSVPMTPNMETIVQTTNDCALKGPCVVCDFEVQRFVFLKYTSLFHCTLSLGSPSSIVSS